MGGCSAMNCSNHSRAKHKMFKFPADPVRRRIWVVNCGREAWVPGRCAQLCSEHFEENQYEQHRADNWKRLKQNAIPTLFKIPKPPLKMGGLRIKGIGLPKPGSLLHFQLINKQKEPMYENLKKGIKEFEAENKIKGIKDENTGKNTAELWTPTGAFSNSVVCSRYFSPSDFKIGLKTQRLLPTSVPHIFQEDPLYKKNRNCKKYFRETSTIHDESQNSTIPIPNSDVKAEDSPMIVSVCSLADVPTKSTRDASVLTNMTALHLGNKSKKHSSLQQSHRRLKKAYDKQRLQIQSLQRRIYDLEKKLILYNIEKIEEALPDKEAELLLQQLKCYKRNKNSSSLKLQQ